MKLEFGDGQVKESLKRIEKKPYPGARVNALARRTNPRRRANAHDGGSGGLRTGAEA